MPILSILDWKSVDTSAVRKGICVLNTWYPIPAQCLRRLVGTGTKNSCFIKSEIQMEKENPCYHTPTDAVIEITRWERLQTARQAYSCLYTYTCILAHSWSWVSEQTFLVYFAHPVPIPVFSVHVYSQFSLLHCIQYKFVLRRPFTYFLYLFSVQFVELCNCIQLPPILSMNSTPVLIADSWSWAPTLSMPNQQSSKIRELAIQLQFCILASQFYLFILGFLGDVICTIAVPVLSHIPKGLRVHICR